MPILPIEASVFPDRLLENTAELMQPGCEWRVLHTKPRQEKSLARDLIVRGIPFYLPQLSQERRVGGRKTISHNPLFDGYLFLHGTEENYLEALSTQRVVRGLRVPDQERLTGDLQRIFRLIQSGLPLIAEPALVPGQLVEVVSGPLEGFTGKVIRASSGQRLVIEVDFIRRGASVLCERMSLRAIDGAKPACQRLEMARL